MWFVLIAHMEGSLCGEFRVPVFERRIDNIVGIAYAMDMLDYVEQVKLPNI